MVHASKVRKTIDFKEHQANLKRKEVASVVTDIILTAYPSSSPYAICPPNVADFQHLVASAYDTVQEGIPVSVESHERSAVSRYWFPFCKEVGMVPMRPPHATLNPSQRRAEDNMRAIFLPWTHARMRGVKRGVADPNSVMSVLRHIVNMLDRENDEKTYSNKPKQVLKGMLTRHVKDYGPLLPDQSLPPPRPVIAALLTLPNGTKLGTYELQWSQPEMVDLKAMYETSLQSGLRLEECAVGANQPFDKRKMSRRSLTWRIGGKVVILPTPSQLKSLSASTSDGAMLLPGCSKCDRWGNKHGHKVIFLPFHANHIFNAARSLRAMELQRPLVTLED